MSRSRRETIKKRNKQKAEIQNNNLLAHKTSEKIKVLQTEITGLKRKIIKLKTIISISPQTSHDQQYSKANSEINITTSITTNIKTNTNTNTNTKTNTKNNIKLNRLTNTYNDRIKTLKNILKKNKRNKRNNQNKSKMGVILWMKN